MELQAKAESAGVPNEQPIPDTMSINEAAAFLKIHPCTLGERARAGEIPSCKIGRSWVFHRGLLDDYVKTKCLERTKIVPRLGGRASTSLASRLAARRAQRMAGKESAAKRRGRFSIDAVEPE